MDASEKALQLFLSVSNSTRGYAEFLKKHRFDGKKVTTPQMFRSIPYTDKHNYINTYSIADRLYGGKKLSDFYMICTSSGTSGKPTFWPRDIEIDTSLEALKEALYEEHFQIRSKKTLCVITFGLGAWTAGMLTAKLSWATAKKNKFTVVTPGIQKETSLELIKSLAPSYDQVLIVGYPPFITDLVEYAKQKKISLKKLHTKLLYTSEHVSEKWRTHMTKAVSATNNRHDVVGFYACSDTGIIGTETRFTIDLLKLAADHPKICRELFNSEITPSFVTYDPMAKYLECVDGEIYITANQPMPLIRYNIHDRGGLLTGDKLRAICSRNAIPFDESAANRHFVYIFGRSDSVKITANIYIEDIRFCIEHSRYSYKLSGNFKYGTIPSSSTRYRMKVVLYLQPGASFTTDEQLDFSKEFYTNLMNANNDFKMIQSGTTIEPFEFVFLPDEPNKYKTSKLKYFL